MIEKKELTPQEIEKIKQNAAGYVFYTPSEAMNQLIAKMVKDTDVTK